MKQWSPRTPIGLFPVAAKDPGSLVATGQAPVSLSGAWWLSVAFSGFQWLQHRWN